MSWPTTTDGQYYKFEGEVLIPVDPARGAANLILRPQGGIGVGIPAIEDGAPGAAATFQEGAVAFTELDYDDPTAAGLTVTEVSPGVYALSGQLHAGAPGDDGTTSIDVESISGTAVAGKLIKLSSGLTSFEFAYEKVASRHLPATLNNTSSGNSASTLGVVSVSARNNDWRPLVIAQTIVTQDGGSDIIVDLLARLNGESGGNIVAKCHGVGGTERLTICSASPAGSADTYDKVNAGDAATIHLRAEKRSGTNSFTTSNSTTLFEVWAIPV